MTTGPVMPCAYDDEVMPEAASLGARRMFDRMFFGCSSLTGFLEQPPTKVVFSSSVCDNMLSECSSLVKPMEM